MEEVVVKCMRKIFQILVLVFTLQGFGQSFDTSLLNSFLEEHVSEEGKVNYANISSATLNPILNQFVKNSPKDNWSKEETLAYWINAYNIFTIKLIVDNYPLKSIKEISQPWDKKFIPINGELLSLNQIEHKIIRKMNEPRIHFAIVCAAQSCPKLYNSAFTAKTLDEDLTKLTQEFLADHSKNSIAMDTIEISKIFQWFTSDFKQNGETLIAFLNRYSSIKISPKATIKYKDYNWSLNE